MAGSMYTRQNFGTRDKALYLSAKEFAGNVSKGNVQTKADVEEKSDSTTRTNDKIWGIGGPLLQRKKK